MREARIIIPKHDGQGGRTDLVVSAVCASFAHRFGGYTLSKAKGGYVNSKGFLEEEKVRIIDVACGGDPGSVAESYNIAFLRQTASQVAYDAKQECVYLRLPHGDVELVEPRSGMGEALQYVADQRA